MKKIVPSTAKSSVDATVESFQKLIGKRTRSIVLINNNETTINKPQDTSELTVKGQKR